MTYAILVTKEEKTIVLAAPGAPPEALDVAHLNKKARELYVLLEAPSGDLAGDTAIKMWREEYR